MGFIYDEGVAKAIERLEDPERFKRHDPWFVLQESGLKKGDVLADLGCGTGFFTLPASSIVGDTGIIYAIDKVQEVLDVLKKKVKEREILNIKAINADILATPINSSSVFMALLACVLHHLPQEPLGRELKRILKRDGTVSVVDWRKIPTDRGPPLQHRFSEEEAASRIMAMGFQVRRIYHAGPTHYGIIAQNIL